MREYGHVSFRGNVFVLKRFELSTEHKPDISTSLFRLYVDVL